MGQSTGAPDVVGSDEFQTALADARDGDGQGFAWLYRHYNRPVSAFVRSERCADPDDLLNTVFYKAFRSIDRFVGTQANFAAYLYQLARFQVIDDRRARNRRADIDDVTNDDSTPESTVRSHQALQALTPEQREVMVLRVFFGLSGPETAEALDKPIGAIRSLQNRAEARLRGLVEFGAVQL